MLSKSTKTRQFGTRLILAIAYLAGGTAGGGRSESQEPQVDLVAWLGSWSGELTTPGGPLEFHLTIEESTDGPVATINNASERIILSDVAADESVLEIEFPHFDSQLSVTLAKSGTEAMGSWRKRRSGSEVAELPARLARPAEGSLDEPRDFLGRWRVQFANEEDPAVAIFSMAEGRRAKLEGTFLTTTGDYRFLSGTVRQGRLVLSCFDGAHAFLFHAGTTGEGKLEGEFWSGNWWHDTWQAVRDSDARLPDAFGLTRWRDDVSISDLEFPDPGGRMRKLRDPDLLGRATIVELFGSWCPNCHDAADLLRDLQKEYGDQGLKILGLAFELSGDFDRDARQVRRYVDRFQVTYPVLIAGTTDKELASKRFPLLDRIRAYPTFVFLDSTATVRAVYTGFSGPATGSAHTALQDDFRRTVGELLER
jgi:thiol-disulfide isomerase/thioredoxin